MDPPSLRGDAHALSRLGDRIGCDVDDMADATLLLARELRPTGVETMGTAAASSSSSSL